MTLWESVVGYRPPVSINLHHLLDLTEQNRSLLASCLEEVEPGLSAVLSLFEQDDHGRDHMMALGDSSGALLQSFLAEQALNRSDSFVDSNGVLQPRFSRSDLGLIRDFPAWRRRFADESRAQPIAGIDLVDIPDHVRIAVVGDWGVGTKAARLVTESIRMSSIDVLIHLGDVYYSGTDAEVQGYLLDPWPVDPEAILSRVCNSNHEMYAGGTAFQRKTLPFMGQSSSIFALRNASWLFIGLDTGSQEGELSSDQVGLVLGLLNENPGQAVALFSHHPIYSLESGVEPRMWETSRALLDTGRVARWYSAHEHACIFFDEDAQGVHVRCIGNGGFPYLLPVGGRAQVQRGSEIVMPSAVDGAAPSARLQSGASQYRVAGHRYGPEGWLEIGLGGKSLSERLVTMEGQVQEDSTGGVIT